jgi:hypothetical protein
VMAASRPDLVLSWGAGWDEVFRRRRVGEIVDVGSPRSDDLASLPLPVAGRVLLCSQPHWHAALGGEAAATAWYELMERVVAGAPAESLRVRLHPWEQDRLPELPLGPATRAVLSTTASFHDDLGWSGAVVGWASTTLVEAAGAGRPVVSLVLNPAAAEMARSYLFFRDPRVVTRTAEEVTGWPVVEGAIAEAGRGQQGLAGEYLANLGSAAKAAAEALDLLV